MIKKRIFKILNFSQKNLVSKRKKYFFVDSFVDMTKKRFSHSDNKKIILLPEMLIVFEIKPKNDFFYSYNKKCFFCAKC